jgi:hypothetical protein
VAKWFIEDAPANLVLSPFTLPLMEHLRHFCSLYSFLNVRNLGLGSSFIKQETRCQLEVVKYLTREREKCQSKVKTATVG